MLLSERQWQDVREAEGADDFPLKLTLCKTQRDHGIGR